MRTIFAGYNPQSTAGWKFRLQDLLVDYDTRQIFVGKKEIDLTQTEYNITHSPVPPSLLGSYASSSTVAWVIYQKYTNGMPAIILYHYAPTRSGDIASEFLKGFHGYLMVDGYTGYNKVKDIRRCCCFAHIRRYFFDAIPKGKQRDISIPAVQGVEYCDKLFAYERHFKEKDYSNRRDLMMTYLEDGRCSLSNNLSEQKMKSLLPAAKAGCSVTPWRVQRTLFIYNVK